MFSKQDTDSIIYHNIGKHKSLIICDHSITDSFGQFSLQKAFQVNRMYTLDVSSKIGSPCGRNGNFETNSCSFYLPSGDFSYIRGSSYIYIKWHPPVEETFYWWIKHGCCPFLFSGQMQNIICMEIVYDICT